MSSNGKEKVVLAFSGGLDTSYCVKYLIHEKGLEIYSILVNTGGFSAEELEEIEKRAYSLGVKEHRNVDVQQKFYEDAIRFMVFGNILKNHSYPLSVSAERTIQAETVAEYVKEKGADYVAHGSTGAGNDQVRFDFIFEVLIPDVKILTPIRDLKLSRQEEIDYLKSHGVESSWEKSRYSINQGLWGTSVGGVETLTSNTDLPESAYPTQLTETEISTLKISFKKGEVCGVNDRKMDPVSAIKEISRIAGPYAIGRDIHVGDTIIGIKGRVGFEAAAPLLIIKGHHALEKHTLTKWQLYWKEQLANWYGMMLHEAQYLDPVMRNIEAFLTDSQQTVTGDVFIELRPYHFHVKGIESPHDLMTSSFGAYGEMNKLWSGEDVRGFTRILANTSKIFHTVNKDVSND
ncbi:argininosuccinate synthase [Fulvivirga sedimenti]|uniref:argininosuccinate synthase n=1 Tax=Fulvivirga sedimenti TaxID=2879465 RepID=A0A9X1HTI5_9BACT|nr:argininosuccinate synthase domain-containing protein [Fulvivirga sedimenti]MCA6075241.1 argininosuccinate synthase [Fulvivirga sedimenti]MCA6076418.1 argininosuccinate synthase [Fulvivirga sedimenti]MCA6077546.1 argininosuccinate synthase [Fulvivirga sedimenti]